MAANGEYSSSSPSPSLSPSNMTINAPRYGTTIPNRIFVGGISSETTEEELENLFKRFGKVKGVKIISDRAGIPRGNCIDRTCRIHDKLYSDRAGIPRGYGFVTFDSDEEAKKVLKDGDNLLLKDRKLNVAIAVKKQPMGRSSYDSTQYLTNGTMMYPNGVQFAPQYFTEGQPAYYHPETLYSVAAPAPGPPTSPQTQSQQTMAPPYQLIYQQPFFFAQPQAPPNPYHVQYQAGPQATNWMAAWTAAAAAAAANGNSNYPWRSQVQPSIITNTAPGLSPEYAATHLSYPPTNGYTNYGDKRNFNSNFNYNSGQKKYSSRSYYNCSNSNNSVGVIRTAGGGDGNANIHRSPHYFNQSHNSPPSSSGNHIQSNKYLQKVNGVSLYTVPNANVGYTSGANENQSPIVHRNPYHPANENSPSVKDLAWHLHQMNVN